MGPASANSPPTARRHARFRTKRVATTDDTAAAEATPGAAAPGERLRQARTAAGLTLDEVARELHLEGFIVEAIERDNLDVLGAPVFVKGYLRGYARLVGLPEQEVVDAWTPADAAAGELRPMTAAPDMKRGTSLSMLVLWVALALLLLAVAMYLLGGDDNDTTTVPDEAAAEVQKAPAPAIVVREDFVVPEPTTAPVAAQPEAVTPADAAVTPDAVVASPAREDEPVAAPMPATPLSVSLQLNFSEECWIELSDARRRLLYGLEKQGSARSFEAEPPLRFFVGNVDAVGIRLDDAVYRIPDRVRTGRNTARFILSADDIKAMR